MRKRRKRTVYTRYTRVFLIIERRKLRYRPIEIYLSRAIGKIGREEPSPRRIIILIVRGMK